MRFREIIIWSYVEIFKGTIHPHEALKHETMNRWENLSNLADVQKFKKEVNNKKVRNQNKDN